jgi:hypothetical protein
MRTKKPSGLISSAGAVRLMSHAMMGAALGLVFGLILTLANPPVAVATLLDHGGSSTVFGLRDHIGDDICDRRDADGCRVHPRGGQGILKRTPSSGRALRGTPAASGSWVPASI